VLFGTKFLEYGLKRGNLACSPEPHAALIAFC